MALPASPGASGTGIAANPLDAPATAPSTSPVAVIWCRQVDNEAESPGYTTVPEEFPGHRETLETIRIIGHLTVNVSDTQDYWDPDPAQPLSYYPNLFLYPAYGGRYTCVGRMFLSTEDRPRLGMKTVVLDTAQLLATHEFGATVLRWHVSMGGARPGGRLPPVPDAGLYPVVGEGFLFQRGTTDPVVVVASEQWEPAVQAMLELIRVLPASLLAPAAFLAFPYFLPAAKTDLKEFTEAVPLALALMRVPRGEAQGERHTKRIAAWEAAATVRDLTDGLPTVARGKETVPLVLQYVRERGDAKILPISRRVDLVELPKLWPKLSDPERSSGRERRKEMWRIGTAMESAALLLSKARGRHVPVNAETAKRAQEYLQARLPASLPEIADPGPETSAPVTEPMPDPGLGIRHPPWLQKNETVAPIRVDRVEVVPVSRSDDPSLLPSARPAEPANPPSPPPRTEAPPLRAPPDPPVSATTATVGVAFDAAAFRAELERTVARWVESRLSQIGPPAPPSVAALGEEIDRRVREAVSQALAARTDPVDAAGRLDQEVERRLAASQASATQELRRAIAESEGRAAAAIDARVAAVALSQDTAEAASRSHFEQLSGRLDESERRAIEQAEASVGQRLDDLEARIASPGPSEPSTAQISLIDERIARAVGPEVLRQLGPAVSARMRDAQSGLEQVARSNGEAVDRQIGQSLAKATGELEARLAGAQEDLHQNLAAQVDLARREAAASAQAVQKDLEVRLSTALDQRITEAGNRWETARREAELRTTAAQDGKLRELEARLPTTLLAPASTLSVWMEGRVAEAEARLAGREEAHASELRETQSGAAAELQVRLQAYFDQRLRESAEKERATSVELLARMKGEIDSGLARVVDSPKLQQALSEFAERTRAAGEEATGRAIDDRVRASETRMRTDVLAAVHRLEAIEESLEARGKELRDLELSIRADLSEVERRTAILSDRLVPVVRKTWLKIGDLERSAVAPENEGEVENLRRDFHKEFRRIEAELVARDRALRDRMETSIANQGRVWLTLIRQLSSATGDRRELLPVVSPPEPEERRERARPEVAPDLDDLPDLLKARRRGAPPPSDDPGDDDEDERALRRRRRVGGRTPGD